MSLVWCDPFYRRPAVRRSPWDDFFGGSVIPFRSEFQNWLMRPQQMLSEIDTAPDQIAFDKDKFSVNVDVQQFRPDEISVKVKDDSIIVEGKHEERPDEHGFISRQFLRRYVVPKDHDLSKVESRLSSDGVLTIAAPKTGTPSADIRQIPIQHIGLPSKPMKNK